MKNNITMKTKEQIKLSVQSKIDAPVAFNKIPETTNKIVPCLAFNNQAEEAATFYVSVFRNSKIIRKSYYTFEANGLKPGSILTVDFQINGQPFMAVNGGPHFTFTDGLSLMVYCDTQDEIDSYWSKLTEGGQAVQCGWLTDKYGVSWQIVPSILPKLMSDPAKADRVMKVLMPMVKLDIEKLKQA